MQHPWPAGVILAVATAGLPARAGAQVEYGEGGPYPIYNCDFNEDRFIDALDLAFLIDIVFFGQPDTWDTYCPATRADFTGDGFAETLDLAFMIDYTFFGGPPPVQPCQ